MHYQHQDESVVVLTTVGDLKKQNQHLSSSIQINLHCTMNCNMNKNVTHTDATGWENMHETK